MNRKYPDVCITAIWTAGVLMELGTPEPTLHSSAFLILIFEKSNFIELMHLIQRSGFLGLTNFLGQKVGRPSFPSIELGSF